MNFSRKDKSFTTCHFKFARNLSESTRWANCMWDFYRPSKSIWHCESWHSTWKTRSLWCWRHLKWLVQILFEWQISVVSINGFNSDYETIKYGVPQSSVLGPLLFLIFINDLNTAIKHSETFHFSGDTCILNIKDSVNQINKLSTKT